MAKLTLSVDHRVVSFAKKYAKARGVSVSQLSRRGLRSASSNCWSRSGSAFCAGSAQEGGPRRVQEASADQVSMKRILFDTNVVLDVLLDRQPHVQASAAAWAPAETGASEGILAAHAVTTIHYPVRKERGNASAKRIISAILRVFKVAAVEGASSALAVSRLENAVASAAARLEGCEFIVTRDRRDFAAHPFARLRRKQ